DYASAFLVSAGLMACIGLGLRLVLPREPWKPESGGAARLPLRELARFLGDRSMLGLLLCNIFPCAFVTVCLFQFFIPVSLNAEGVSPAGIGRVFMAFCLLIIVFGPMLGRAVDRSGRKLLWLAGAGFLGVGGILALLAFDGLAAAFLSVGLLALCNAVASSAQGAYALELPATGRFGASRSMGVYNVTERLGQMLGPVTLGQVIALWGAASGLVGMAVVFAVLTLLFLLSGLGARKGTTA
ncbi:MFS transporter, partial [uncultured Bilophila sp.]